MIPDTPRSTVVSTSLENMIEVVPEMDCPQDAPLISGNPILSQQTSMCSFCSTDVPQVKKTITAHPCTSREVRKAIIRKRSIEYHVVLQLKRIRAEVNESENRERQELEPAWEGQETSYEYLESTPGGLVPASGDMVTTSVQATCGSLCQGDDEPEQPTCGDLEQPTCGDLEQPICDDLEPMLDSLMLECDDLEPTYDGCRTMTGPINRRKRAWRKIACKPPPPVIKLFKMTEQTSTTESSENIVLS